MNIRTISSLLLASSFFIVSCKKELEPQQSTVVESETPATVTETETSMPQQVPQTQIQAPTQMQNAPTPQQQVQPQTVAKGMNPAHGQPGHRCDIAVGAPLSSAAGSKAQMPSQPVSTGTKITPAQVNPNGIITESPTSTPSSTPSLLNPNSNTAVGMNPPHGQAGHRCDIAVGQPLP